MKQSWKEIVYPLLSFFSLILSIVIIAKLVGLINDVLASDQIENKLLFISLVVYIALIIAGGYLLVKQQYLFAVIVSGAILLLTICYVLMQGSEFTLLIYYILYAIIVGVIGLSQLKQESKQRSN